MPELPFIPETITVHLGPPDSNDGSLSRLHRQRGIE